MNAIPLSPVPQRKIVQLATIPDGPDNHAALYALCDDGTAWVWQHTRHNNGWEQMTPIPQPGDTP